MNINMSVVICDIQAIEFLCIYCMTEITFTGCGLGKSGKSSDDNQGRLGRFLCVVFELIKRDVSQSKTA